MKNDDLREFMKKHEFNREDLADLLGVTKCGVDHWLTGIRRIPETTARLLRLFDKDPDLMRKFY